MERMIRVINDNLKNVVAGIKDHKMDLESTLDGIRSDMATSVKEANSYKTEVEEARTIVYSLENEITDLEKDLDELNEKFGSKDFKEILAAGNKEINAKIMEKKSLINEQGRIILALTEKARNLKDELVDLRERKITTEEELKKTKILESYYELRVTDIIKFSEEHPEELASYRDEVPQDELDIEEDIDITGVIDGSIFEEIDEISGNEPDQDLLQNALANPEEIPVYEKEEEEEQPIAIDISTAHQLDNMIIDATNFMNKTNGKKDNENDIIDISVSSDDSKAVETYHEDINPYIDIAGLEKELAQEETLVDDGIEVTNSEIGLVEIEGYVPKEDKDSKQLEIDESSASDRVGLVEIEGYVPKENKDSEQPENDESTASDKVGLVEIEGYVPKEAPEAVDDMLLGGDKVSIVVEDVPKIIDEVSAEIEKEVENDEKKEETAPEKEDLSSVFEKYDMNIKMFSKAERENLEKSDIRSNLVHFVKTMKKHNIELEKFYDNANILIALKPRKLEKILTLIEKTDATHDDILLVFKYLDKVNIDKFEQFVNTESDPSLASCLGQAIDTKDDVIGSTLGLSRKAEETLKKTASKEEMKIMNALPDMVLENYREVRALNVDNIEDCISKHPHRFTLTHSKFHEILDKYDTEDLIRCINKNPAVIDKL